MEQKIVLITGVAGFLASHVSEMLLQRGDVVVGVDEVNDYYSLEQKEHNLEILSKYENFHFYKQDLADFDLLEKIFEEWKPTHVGHIAARAGVRPSIEDPFIYEHSNIQATLNLLELAKRFNVKNFVLTSSSSVYGDRSKVPFREDEDVTKPISPYAATKVSTEVMAYTYHHLYGLNVNVIRPFTLYGPRGRPDMAPFLFSKWINEGTPIKKFGDGSTKRDYTYVGDFADGFVKAIDKPLGYEIFNFGNSTPITLNEFIETIERTVGKKALINQMPMQPGDVSITYADISKAKELLGYEPKTKLADGMKIFWDWYKEFYKVE